MSDQEERASCIWVSSLFGLETREPLVEICMEYEGRNLSIQVSPDEARKIALNILAAAEAALGDAFLVQFARDRVGTSDQGAAHMLHEYRQWRMKQEQEP